MLVNQAIKRINNREEKDYEMVPPQAKDKSAGIGLPTGVAKDEKGTSVVPSAGIMIESLRNVLRTSNGNARKGKGSKKAGKAGKIGNSVSVWLAYQTNAASSATTAQAVVFALEPSVYQEWSSFAAVYDEAKVTEVKVQYWVQLAAANTVPIEVGVAYDPLNAVAYSTAIATQLATHHDYCVIPGVTDAVLVQTRSGYRGFRFKVPGGTEIQFGNSGFVGNNWFNTSAPTTGGSYPSAGYLKAYVDAPTAGLSTITLNIFTKMEFRMRS